MKYLGVLFNKKLLEKLYSVGYICSVFKTIQWFVGTTEITELGLCAIAVVVLGMCEPCGRKGPPKSEGPPQKESSC